MIIKTKRDKTYDKKKHIGLKSANIAGKIIEPFDVTSVPQQYRNLDYKTVIYWDNARTLRFKRKD